MDCGTINEKLSAYLDGELSAAEKARVEEHIKTCPKCSPAFEELKKTSARIRSLEEVEPPAWLEQRIMAKVREEAAQKQGLFQKLFFPLRVKVPLQAVATLAVCAVAFLVYRAVEPDIKQARSLQKEAVISEQVDNETPSEKYQSTEDIPESGTGAYSEWKAPQPSPDEPDMARKKLEAARRMKESYEGETLGVLKQKGDVYGEPGIGPARDQSAGSKQLFSARPESAAVKEDSFKAEIVRYATSPKDDTIIEVLFRRPDTGELFCGSFPSEHDLSQFITGLRENSVPELELTAGPPYRGGCLLYEKSRKVISWTEKSKSQNTDPK